MSCQGTHAVSLIHLLDIDDEVKHQRGSSDSKPKDGDHVVEQPETEILKDIHAARG